MGEPKAKAGWTVVTWILFSALVIVLLLVTFVTVSYYDSTINNGEYAVAMGTLLLALATFALVMEQNKNRIEQYRPVVIPSILVPYGKFWMFFVIRNEGRGIAKEIRVRTKPDLINSKGRNYSQMGYLKTGIDYLGPGEERKTFFDAIHQYYSEKAPHPMDYSFEVSYRDSADRRYQESLKVNLRQYEDYGFLAEKDFGDLVKETEKVSRELNSIRRSIDNAGIGIEQMERAMVRSARRRAQSYYLFRRKMKGASSS